jgi:hypothetical protein
MTDGRSRGERGENGVRRFSRHKLTLLTHLTPVFTCTRELALCVHKNGVRRVRLYDLPSENDLTPWGEVGVRRGEAP